MQKRGPKTAMGKAMIRLNAVKHGILSTLPVVGQEKPEDWLEHLDGILASYAPANELEAVLAERIALNLWRLRRVEVFETAAIASEMDKAENDWWREEMRRKNV